jgi:hypothetical protein
VADADLGRSLHLPGLRYMPRRHDHLIRTYAPGPAGPHGALHPLPRPAPGSGEPRLGYRRAGRRAARARAEGGSLYRVGDLEGGRDRPRARTRGHDLGQLPAIPGRGPPGVRLPRNGHPVGDAGIRACGDRAPYPPDPGAGRDGVPDRLVGGPGRPEPGYGSSGRREPGAVLDPGPGREVPGVVRRGAGRCGDHGGVHRCPADDPAGPGSHQPGAHAPGRGRRAGGQAELAQDVGQMPVDGVLAQKKPLGDVVVAQSLRDELEHIKLAGS